MYPASRAVEDDDDDLADVAECPPAVVRWSADMRTDESSPLPCKSLIIAIGPVATGFLQVYVLDSQPSDVIGSISCSFSDDEVSTFTQTTSSDKTCLIHRMKTQPDLIMVQCNATISPEQSFSWMQQLCTGLSLAAAEVVVLTTTSLVEFKSAAPAGDLPRNFLRTLCTRAAHRRRTNEQVCTALEQPNTVAGLPAQVLTYCEVHDISCALYVCYVDTTHIEAETIRAFKKLLPLFPFSSIAKENANVNDRLVKLVKTHANHSSLYI